MSGAELDAVLRSALVGSFQPFGQTLSDASVFVRLAVPVVAVAAYQL